MFIALKLGVCLTMITERKIFLKSLSNAFYTSWMRREVFKYDKEGFAPLEFSGGESQAAFGQMGRQGG